jgi:hypothetical protein
MSDNDSNKIVERRAFLFSILRGWATIWFFTMGFVRHAYALGALKFPTGVQKLKGRVSINGKTAQEGDLVKPGDVIITGAFSMVIFVVGKSVYLLRDNTRLEIQHERSASGNKAVTEVARIINGKMLAVFGRKRQKRIITKTAVAGVRGSAIYVESKPDKTYFCLCYGKADLMARDDPSIRETVQTSYHDAPRFVYGADTDQRIEEAPVFNHTDKELIMLEAIAWRKPPFVRSGGNGGGGY